MAFSILLSLLYLCLILGQIFFTSLVPLWCNGVVTFEYWRISRDCLSGHNQLFMHAETSFSTSIALTQMVCVSLLFQIVRSILTPCTFSALITQQRYQILIDLVNAYLSYVWYFRAESYGLVCKTITSCSLELDSDCINRERNWICRLMIFWQQHIPWSFLLYKSTELRKLHMEYLLESGF